jgi:hypothetical protein
MFKTKLESIFKCWNCHGFGLIPSEYPMESDADSESFTYGETCPICKGTRLPHWLVKILLYLSQIGLNIQF